MLKRKVEFTENRSQNKVGFDGGANAHTFKDKEYFISLETFSRKTVSHGVNSTVYAEGIDQVKLSFLEFDVTLDNVDYSPECRDNTVASNLLYHIFDQFTGWPNEIICHFRSGRSTIVVIKDKSHTPFCNLIDSQVNKVLINKKSEEKSKYNFRERRLALHRRYTHAGKPTIKV